MSGKHCRLYDEDLLKSIMLSTGLSVCDFVRGKKEFNEEDVCTFVELNTERIIANTINEINEAESDASFPFENH